MAKLQQTQRESIKTATISKDTRGILEVMAIFIDASTAFYEWAENYYADKNRIDEFENIYEETYHCLQQCLNDSVFENMGKIGFTEI